MSTEPAEQTTTTASATFDPGPLKLSVSIHVEGFQKEARDQEQFNRHVDALLVTARAAHDGGAIFSFEFSDVFMDAVRKWNSTVIEDLKALGHGTGVHADVGGQGNPSQAEMVSQLSAMKRKAEALGVDTRHVSGVCSRGPWVEAVIEAGFQSTNGAVEYCALSLDPIPADWDLSPCTDPSKCHGQLRVSDDLKIHPYFISSSKTFISPSTNGLVFMLGDSGSTVVCKAEESARTGKCVGKSDDLPLMQAVVDSFVAQRDPKRVASLSMSWSIGSIPDESFVREFVALFDPYVANGSAEWMSNGDVGELARRSLLG